jgi:hypothetical protein
MNIHHLSKSGDLLAQECASCITVRDGIFCNKTPLRHKFRIGPSEVRAPAVGVAHAGGERSVHY